jgi:hypothetical protein
MPGPSLHFRQRVLEVKTTPLLSQHSLCHTLHATLCKYQLEDQWDLMATDQVYEAEEWHGMVSDRVLLYEQTSRQLTLASKSSLDTYQKALVPPLGEMAPYLLHSRNREGAWIRCRLRSSTLPLMQVLSRHCRPPRPDVHSICPLCPQSQDVESTEHFLSSCQSSRQCHLRQQLCSRLQQALLQWHQTQRDALMEDWSELPPVAAAAAVSVREAHTHAINGYDAITSTLESMSVLMTRDSVPVPVPTTNASAQPPAGEQLEIIRTDAAADAVIRGQWCELLLGRSIDPTSDRAWDPSLLQVMMRPIHNFLLLAWRTRAEQLGGVPTLNPAGRGIHIAPYRRMKSIGVKPTSRRGCEPLPARMQPQSHC